MCVTACEDVDATFALQMNTVRLIQRPFSTVSRGLFNLRSVGNADIPQCSVIEFHQGSNSLFDLTFAAPMPGRKITKIYGRFFIRLREKYWS